MTLAELEPYDPARVGDAGDHAVVLGASVAGLLAARVLADAFARVTVVERDPLDGRRRARRGVPQGRHLHVLLSAGQQVVEQLCPGTTDDLVAAGALRLDFGRDVRVHVADGFLTNGSRDLPLYYATRPLVEEVVRARIVDHPRVTLRPGCQVVDHLADTRDGTVGGVVVAEDGIRHEVPADLVVDATGRSSRTATWLRRLGRPVPETETVRVDLAYRTCRIRRPESDHRALLVLPSPPRTRGAAVAPVEEGQWLVTLFGMHGDHPPDDLDGLRTFASTLPCPDVAQLLEDHEPVTSEVDRHRFPSSVRHRFDQLAEHPHGLVCVGDAVASFNPIYGQGMSVAALQALALHHALADHDLEALAPALHRRVGGLVDDVWRVAAGADFAFPQTDGPKPPGTDLVNRYVHRLHRRAHRDARLSDAFARVATLEQSPTSLFRPPIPWRVLRPQRRTSPSSPAAPRRARG